MGITIWNQSFEEWLIRTGNGQKHGTTKRKPVEMFADEQEHLLPLYGVAPAEIAEEMDRNVRPDNTVMYKSNRYSVPYGTYSIDKKVFLEIEEGKLHILNRIGEPLAMHIICGEKGKLIKQDAHRRDKKERVKALLDKAVALLGEGFQEYLAILCEEKPRYVKEQLEIVKKACEAYGRESVLAAMEHCRRLSLYSANDLRDVAQMMAPLPQPPPSRLPVEDERYHIPVQKRALSVYAEVAAGSGVGQ
jgi:hypothetical protein